MSITANMTKSEIIDFLENKLQIELKPEFNEKELDGEALLLLRIIDIKPKELGVQKNIINVFLIIVQANVKFFNLKTVFGYFPVFITNFSRGISFVL